MFCDIKVSNSVKIDTEQTLKDYKAKGKIGTDLGTLVLYVT